MGGASAALYVVGRTCGSFHVRVGFGAFYVRAWRVGRYNVAGGARAHSCVMGGARGAFSRGRGVQDVGGGAWGPVYVRESSFGELYVRAGRQVRSGESRGILTKAGSS